MTLTDYMCQEERERERESERERGRKLACIEDSVDTSIQQLEDYTGKLITAPKDNKEDTRTSGMAITRKQKWEEKQFYWRFNRRTSDLTLENVDLAKKRQP